MPAFGSTGGRALVDGLAGFAVRVDGDCSRWSTTVAVDGEPLLLFGLTGCAPAGGPPASAGLVARAARAQAQSSSALHGAARPL